MVPDDRVADECKLDKDLLSAADAEIGEAYAVIRYGKLCHQYLPTGSDSASEMWSATKTMGAVVVGIASYETRNYTQTGPKTGPLTDTDRADYWLDSFTFNDDARIAHIMAMLAQNNDLNDGQMTYSYDTVGSVQINRLSDVVNAAISQDTVRLGNNIEAFTQKFLYEPLGMTDSTWTSGSSNKTFAYSWSSTLQDMARVGLVILHRGMYNGQRVLAESWTYRMTHPSFEEANTAYGYLTWLNSRGGGTGPAEGISDTGDPCAPAALWNTYPHGLSTYPDCNASPGYSCEQVNDMGVWSAQGLGGQFIVGHPGLDLLIVAKNYDSGTGPVSLWDAIRPALVALDPVYAGDEEAFCAAYAGTTYAPDMATQPTP